ncbi:MFS transporter [Ochrobactrum sp. 3-3]|uniref:MFS transporter n=1 Tax=Ochrobactrum sp. 3-3 TaxID=1830124 RepID=UPI000DEFEF3D|nr:MFS transporter [Ochrobactrum sp. 3-3]
MIKECVTVSSKSKILFFCVCLALYELIVYAASDVIMPSMLRIADQLGGSPLDVPLSLNLYLLGGVVVPLIIGSLSDYYGRRKPMIAGCLLSAFAFFVTAFIGSMTMFKILRFIQGMGIGFIIAIGLPTVHETFTEKDAVRVLAIVSNVAILSPLGGPFVGSVLLNYIDWREMFLAMAVITLLLSAGLWLSMPETVDIEHRGGRYIQRTPLGIREIARDYRALLANRHFLLGGAALGFVGLPLISWIALSSLLLMHSLGYSGLEYSLWQIPVFGGLIVGNFALGILCKRFSLTTVLCGGIIAVAGGTGGALTATLYNDTPIALISGFSIYAAGFGICSAIIYQQILALTIGATGKASALLGVLNVTIYAIGGVFLTVMGAGDNLKHFIILVSIPAVIAVTLLFSLLVTSRVTTAESAS